MSWEITIVAGVIVAILVLFLKSKGSAKTEDTAPNETSRRLLANFVDQNRRRIAGMSDDEKVDIESKLRQEAEVHWAHGFDSAMADGKGETFATQVALFGTACAVLAADQHPDKSLHAGLDLETVPFKSLDAERAKAAFIEYCVSKYFPDRANWKILNDALLTFGTEVFNDSKSQANPDVYVYEMIYRETLDWQKYLARELSKKAA